MKGIMGGKKKEASKVIYEGWMVRYGRRKIGRSFIHMRYFVLESTLLAYYKKKPKDTMLPLKTLHIDGRCRVEDRGLKPHHGHMVYVLCIYNKKESYNRITMAAFNIQEALLWKEKIELVIDQYQDSSTSDGHKPFTSYKSTVGHNRNLSFDDHDSQYSQDDEEEVQQALPQTTKTIGNEPAGAACTAGPPGPVPDWTQELETGLLNQDNSAQAASRRHWRLVRCQNGLRIFEELLQVDHLPRSCSRAMKAVGVVDATCEAIFELIISMDETRFEWDCTFQYGSLVEEVDGHTAILYHRLYLDWMPRFVWPRDLCYVRYWRHNDDGSYVVLFRSREHAECGPQPGFVRAHIESGGFKISPLRSRNGRPRTQVQHLMQIDLKGWIAGHFHSFQQYSLLQMLTSVAGLREWFSQTDETRTIPRIPMMFTMASDCVSPKKDEKAQDLDIHPTLSLEQIHSASKHSVMLDEESDEDDDQIPEIELEASSVKLETDIKQIISDEEPSYQIDLSCFSGNLHRNDLDDGRNCWKISDGNNFKVRGKSFASDKRKTPAGKPLMELVAVDWLKDTKRMDHVARRHGCAVQVASEKGLLSLAINLQVPGSTCYSLVFYFVVKTLVPGSLLQRFFDGDDEFRNSRFKLIPSVPKGSWIVRQSVGSSACLLAKAVDCNFIRGPKYLEIDVDIGSSTVANGVLGLVLGVITTLVVDMAFLVQGNTPDELPEQIIGAVRISHVELSSAVVAVLGASPDNAESKKEL